MANFNKNATILIKATRTIKNKLNKKSCTENVAVFTNGDEILIKNVGGDPPTLQIYLDIKPTREKINRFFQYGNN